MKDSRTSVERMLATIESLDVSIRLAKEFKSKLSQQPEYLMQVDEEIEALQKRSKYVKKH